ncbi:MAG: response regulator, partial [Candidatus Methylomirabilales bacterium]
MQRSQVLVIGGPSESAEYIQGLLPSRSITTAAVASRLDALQRLREKGLSAVVLYLDGVPAEGCKIITAAQKGVRSIPVVVITEAEDNTVLAECAAAGAFDCLVKPVDPSTLSSVMHRALTWNQLCAPDRSESAETRKGTGQPFSDIVGDSEAMQEVYHWVHKVAPADA